jgi:hypothetical protein
LAAEHAVESSAYHFGSVHGGVPQLFGGRIFDPSMQVMTAKQKSALGGVVTIDREVTHGTPCFANTRVPV